MRQRMEHGLNTDKNAFIRVPSVAILFFAIDWQSTITFSLSEEAEMTRTLFACCLFFAPLTVAAADKPNVLMIVGDDWGWTDFGFMGHKEIATPHLDKLASESAVFPNGYVPT